ncbi:hypothetical protein L2E82_35571 [Cichorium intybus]|uniref:Uncharacterized protein n=1 Tax=Cichorium intybus TaxID=13427 RepID=A0ACB9BP45_CICIN|nr:hypothetical protein L2E82_35571 [Cichorium intybus]
MLSYNHPPHCRQPAATFTASTVRLRSSPSSSLLYLIANKHRHQPPGTQPYISFRFCCFSPKSALFRKQFSDRIRSLPGIRFSCAPLIRFHRH